MLEPSGRRFVVDFDGSFVVPFDPPDGCKGLRVVEPPEEFTAYSVTFAAKAPLTWPGAKTDALSESVKEAFAGAEKWLHDQLKRIDEELELVRE